MKPNSKDIYRRLMILKYLIIHSYSTFSSEYLKESAEHWTITEKESFDKELEKDMNKNVSEMKSLGIWEYTTKTEREFLSSFGSKINSVSLMNANWRMEAAIILMWSLNLIDKFPDINEQTNPELLKLVETRKIKLFSNKLTLRPNREILKMRDIIETWHWRVNTRRLIENDFDFQPHATMRDAGIVSLDDVVQMTAKSAYSNGEIKEIIDNDFVFKGKPFRDLNKEDFDEATSIIIERYYALNWLCGLAPRNNWDETPTDT